MQTRTHSTVSRHRHLAAFVGFVVLLTCALLFPSRAHAAMTIDSGPRVSVDPYQTTIWWYSSSTGSSELRWDIAPVAWADMAHDESNTDTDLGTLHSRTIENLGTGTYYFRIRTSGAAGTVTSGLRTLRIDDADAATPLGSLVVEGNVDAQQLTPDGATWYIGGDFTKVGTRTGAGAVVDAGTGTRLPGVPQVSGTIEASVPDGLGGVFIGGTFTRVGGLRIANLAHLLPDGGIDPTFTTPIGTVNALTRSGSTLFVGGYFSAVGGVPRNHLAAVSTTDASVLPFSVDTNQRVTNLAVAGSTLYAAGYFTTIGGQSRTYVASMDINTGAVTPLSLAPNGPVESIAADGSMLYVGGMFTSIAGASRIGVAAIDTTIGAGTATAFDASSNNYVGSLALDGSTLYVGGSFSTIGGQARSMLAGIDVATGLATAFDPNITATGLLGGGSITDLVLDGTTLAVSGQFSTVGGQSRTHVALVDVGTANASTLDVGLGIGSYSRVTTVSFLGGNVFVGGYLSTMNATTRNRIAAIDTATMSLTPFDPDPNAAVTSLALSGSRLFVGGSYTTIAGQPRSRLASFDTTTGLLEAFDPGPNNDVYSMVASAGTLYLSGGFTSISGQPRARIAAVVETTGVATGFDPSSTTTPTILTVDGSTVYVGLTTATIGGQVRTGIAALDATTGTATAFNPSANGQVNTALVDGGRLIVGGSFTTIAGQPRNRLASLDPTTGVADAFDPNLNGAAYSIVRMGADFVVAGYFFSASGQGRSSIAVIDAATGTLRTRNLRVVNRASTQYATALVFGSRIYVAGRFEGNGFDVVQSGIAAFETAAARSDQMDVAPLSITVAPQLVQVPTQATIYWSTSASSSSELVWDRTSRATWSEYQRNASNAATGLGTRHSRTIANLPAGNYFYRVRSRTAAGEQVTSAERSFYVESPSAATPLNTSVINGRVEAQAVSDDGTTLYVGGSFTRVGTRVGAGVSVDAAGTGSVRAGTPHVAGFVSEAVSDGVGGWYIVGSFGSVGAVNTYHLAHLLPDGGVDPSFTFSFSDGGVIGVTRVGTTLYVGGDFLSVNGIPRARIAAIDLTTNTVTGFDPGADDSVTRLAADGGALYIGGKFTAVAGAPRARLAAIDIATALPTAFVADVVGGSVVSIAIDGSTLYAGGSFSQVNGQPRGNIAAVDTTTGAVAPFAPDANDTVWSIVPTGGAVYVGGLFTLIGGQPRNRIAEIDMATGLALAFDPGTDGLVTRLALDGTTLYVTGSFGSLAGQPRSNAGAIDTSTGLATNFDPSPDAPTHSIATDGTSTFLGGEFTSVHGAARTNFAALDARTGALLSATANTNGRVRALLTVGSTLYVGGSFTTIDGQPRNRLAGLDVSLAPTSFDPDVDGTVRTIGAFDPSTIGIGGDFSTVGGVARSNIAGVDTSTGIVTAFDVAVDGPVNAAVLDGTTVFIGGDFDTVGGQPRSNIAAVDGIGNVPLPFDPGADDEVLTLLVDGSTLYAGGDFTTIAGQPRSHLAAVDTSTGLATAFDPGVDGAVRALHLSGPRLFVGGTFNTAGGVDALGLATIDTVSGTATVAVKVVNLSSGDAAVDPGGIYSIVTTGDRVAVGGLYNIPFIGSWLSHSGTMLFDICDRQTFCSGEGIRDYVTVSATSGPAALGSIDPGASSTATVSVDVESNAVNGYALFAIDSSNTSAMSCVSAPCGTSTIPDWTGTDAAPSQWAPADSGPEYGFGVTVLGTTQQPKYAKWGTGVTATDFVANRYAGVRQTSAVVLHLTTRFIALTPDRTTLGLRARVAPTQAAGDYAGSISLIAVPNI